MEDNVIIDKLKNATKGLDDPVEFETYADLNEYIDLRVQNVLSKVVPIEIKLSPGAYRPTKSYETDAAWDVSALEDIWCRPGESTEVPTGVFINIPPGYEGEVKARSSWGRRGLSIHHGVYDAGYQGELSIYVHNWTFTRYEVKADDRIAQFCLRRVLPIEWKTVEVFTPSLRGTKGQGSSGR